MITGGAKEGFAPHKAVVSVSSTEGPVQRLEVEHSPCLIGRGLECDMVLEDSAASREHAMLLWEGGAWLLRDLDSTNGIFIRGEQRNRITLCDGDEVVIGSSTLHFSLPLLAAPATADSTVVRSEAGSGDSTATRPRGIAALSEGRGARRLAQRRRRLLLVGASTALLALVLVWALAGLNPHQAPTPPPATRASTAAPTAKAMAPAASAETALPVKPAKVSDQNKALALRHLEKGGVFMQAGRLPDAVREYRRATELDPGNKLARIRLEKARHQQRESAKQSLERGLVNFKFLNYELAAQEWRRVLNLVPEPDDPLHRKALDYLEKVRGKLGR